jgi:GrpB-like predicted nucleotidyltransferase (UPF0157 family)
MAAKPVIDIQVSVPSFESRTSYQRLLDDLGYMHFPLGDFDLVYPFIKRPATWPSTHHVRLSESGSEQERNHLLFRDYLRGHPRVAAEYAALKLKLAAAHDGLTMKSQELYSLSKTDFVHSVFRTALQERAAR